MHELWYYRWMEAAQVEPNFSVYTHIPALVYVMVTVSSFSLLLLLIFPILPDFLSFIKVFPQRTAGRESHGQSWGRNQFPAGGMKTVMKQQGPASTISTPRMTCHVHSPSPAALLSLPQEQAQAKTLTDSKHFSSSSNKALYPDPLPPQEEGWTPSTGQQAHADRAFSVILASYSQCLAETADCTTMKPSLLD